MKNYQNITNNALYYSQDIFKNEKSLTIGVDITANLFPLMIKKYFYQSLWSPEYIKIWGHLKIQNEMNC